MGALAIFEGKKKVESVRFSPTKPGETVLKTVQVKNEALKFAKISKIIIHDKGVGIIKAPKSLEPKVVGDLTLSFTPKKGSLETLNTTIEFEVILGDLV